MHLILDVGNTRIKAAVFKDSELVHLEIFTVNSCADEIIKIVKKHNCLNGIISSVGAIKKNELIKIKSKINLFELRSTSKVPFFNNYATPKTLGVDRIALAASAITNFPNTNTLVIDAGTCITFDYVNKEGFYLGGAISPGLKMRYRAMHDYTAKLPLLNISESHKLIGDSTETSMHSGVINGVISEIDGAINAYRKKNQDLTVVLTGGDVNFLSNKLKNGIFANPNFLLEGLNTILTYNL